MSSLWRSRWLSVERDGDGDEYFAAMDEVLVVALDDGQSLLLVEEPSPAFRGRGLFLPGGAIEPGEAVVDAAQRELREETGYAATALKLVATLRPWPKYLRVATHIVAASGLVASPLPSDEPYPIVLRRMTRSAVDAAIASGEIDDARVVAALAVCN